VQGVGFTLRQFYIRRFLRIFPLFYATLLVAWACGVAEVRASIGWHVAYLSNVYFALTDAWHPPVSHFWSLAVEEQFYLVWPFLVLLAPARLLVPAIVAAIAMAPAFRWIGAAAGVREMVLYNVPIAALDALGIGALLAVLPATRPGLRAVAERRGFAWGTGALLLLVLALHLRPLATRPPLRWVDQAGLVETVASLAFAGVILGAARLRAADQRPEAPLPVPARRGAAACGGGAPRRRRLSRLSARWPRCAGCARRPPDAPRRWCRRRRARARSAPRRPRRDRRRRGGRARPPPER
jgi:peptidoglycan/LPS O-acetylase OafA/YrhL